MVKYAKARIWRAPDGKLIPESEVKDGQSGGLGTVLAFAEGDEIEGDDEEAVPAKLATSQAPKATGSASLTTTAAATSPTSTSTPRTTGRVVIGSPTDAGAGDDTPTPPTKAELRARADELGLEVRARASNDELAAAIADEEARLAADQGDATGSGDNEPKET